MLEIIRFVLGPVQTNSYLIADPETKEAAVIDPAWDGQIILDEAGKRGWRIGHIWLTHAHFDHFGGVAEVVDGTHPAPYVALHPKDYVLWRAKGGAPSFGMDIDPGPEPTIELHHGQILHLGKNSLEVRHTPGHTPGHVVFYVSKEKVVFSGDVIFYDSIGRTDMPGGDFDTLINSIKTQILTMSDDTHLLSGHGEATTVGRERKYNYFLR